MKVGIDIEEVERFLSINLEKFCQKYFTEYEKNYALKKGVQTVCGIYSCKEAILKAFGLGIGNGVSLKDISILHDEKGKPFIEENQTFKDLKTKYNITEYDISISHTKTIAQSICVLK